MKYIPLFVICLFQIIYIICQTELALIIYGKQGLSSILLWSSIILVFVLFCFRIKLVFKLLKSLDFLITLLLMVLIFLPFIEYIIFIQAASKFFIIFLISKIYLTSKIEIFISWVCTILLGIILYLALQGLIPTSIFTFNEISKFTIGFTNPNTPFFFAFSAFVVFFKNDNKIGVFFVVALILLMILSGSLSRTYFYSMIIILLLHFFYSFGFKLYLYKLMSFVSLFIFIFGIVIFFILQFFPDLVSFLAYSNIDEILSLRISSALETGLSQQGESKKIEILDSLYFELLFIFPFFGYRLGSKLTKFIKKESMFNSKNQLNVRNQLVYFAIVLTGLFQPLMLVISPINFILYKMIYSNHDEKNSS
jgi:hypothetical protein